MHKYHHRRSSYFYYQSLWNGICRCWNFHWERKLWIVQLKCVVVMNKMKITNTKIIDLMELSKICSRPKLYYWVKLRIRWFLSETSVGTNHSSSIFALLREGFYILFAIKFVQTRSKLVWDFFSSNFIWPKTVTMWTNSNSLFSVAPNLWTQLWSNVQYAQFV